MRAMRFLTFLTYNEKFGTLTWGHKCCEKIDQKTELNLDESVTWNLPDNVKDLIFLFV